MQIDPTASSAARLTAVDHSSAASTTSPPPTAFLNGTLDPVAQQLALSGGAVRSMLRDGNSLADIAQASGTSRSDLASFLQQRVQQNREQQNLPPVDPAALDRAVNRAIDRRSR
jgi:hypothetical protein